ncbi:MAG: bifunctional phosphoribosyl-AMP cyclohydrolase/phosphoribosyl-ATP diphosphatase HisIE [Chloroflexi bacterium]|nr:bifunctional phosphoribosyl-AMP cyclohydrolase/phosphoribosyl-ATP diphosphatase HisIE [Chloroflexota bacterium]
MSVPDASALTPRFDDIDLLPAVVQDARSLRVLMVGYMNREAYERTCADGRVWFYSRSRKRLWMKGETSGNVLRVRALNVDCDGDTLLVLADPAGPTCHTNAVSCFFTNLEGQEPLASGPETAAELFDVIKQRLDERPEGSYIARLAARGMPRMAQKVGEEATEVVIAAVREDRDSLIAETADLWFHSLIVLAQAGLTPDDIWAELARRRR